MFVLLARCSGDVSSMPWRVRGTCVSWAKSSVGTPSCPTPPRRPAERPDPTRSWYVRVLGSTGGISFVRASEGSFRTDVFDAFAKKKVGRPLGEPIRRRPTLPRPVAPPHRARRRPDAPVVFPGFGFDKYSRKRSWKILPLAGRSPRLCLEPPCPAMRCPCPAAPVEYPGFDFEICID